MPDADTAPAAAGSTAKAKKKKNKKKGGTEKAATNGDGGVPNGIAVQQPHTPEEDEGDDSPQTPADTLSMNEPLSQSNPTDFAEKLEALAKERDQLRQEVSQLRKSLEDMKGKHEQEIDVVRDQLQEAEAGREEAQTLHSNLKDRVNTITATLGERMRANTEEIAQNNARIEELEEQTRSLEDTNTELQATLDDQKRQQEAQAQEIKSLRSRASLSQQNWVKERDELLSREAFAREEYEQAKQAMQDWEVLAMEERSLRENLTEKVLELEEQLSAVRDAHERSTLERDSQSQAVDGLQRALREIQEARKKELRDMVESSEAQIEESRTKQIRAEEDALSAQSDLEAAQKELERVLPFEMEVKEKNLSVGKLRHEAVILNEHLTKALRFIRQRNPEDMVDRQVVTNHLLHFLTIERTDAKKFQVLQIIAALLGWDEDQKEKAGLARPGASTMAYALRVPLSPFRKSSAASLNTDASLMDQRAGKESKESLADLWSEFLQREATEGLDTSRRPSTASGVTEPGGPTPEEK